MATEITVDPMRGLLIPDERATLWAAESSYTEAGPRAPGATEPGGTSSMTLIAQGDQASGTSYEVQALRAGVARAAPHLSAAMAWRSGSSGNYYGWDAPSLLARVEVPVPVNTGTPTAILYARSPDLVTLPTGVVLIVYEVRDTSAGSPYQVRCSTRTTNGTITTATIYGTTFAVPTDQGYHPAILRLPGGRLLVYHWVFDPDGGEANIRVHYSDDDGVTWAVGQQYALDQPIPYGALASAGSTVALYVVGRLRAAYSLGQVLVVADLTALDTDLAYRSTMLQAASADHGLTLERIEVWDGTTEGPQGVDVIDTPAGFLVAYAAGADASVADAAAPLTVIRVGSAFEPLSTPSHDAVTGPGYNLSAGVNANSNKVTTGSGVALTRLGDAVYLHFVVDHPSLTDHYGSSVYTSDNGATWEGMYGAGSGSTVPAAWVDAGETSAASGTANKRPMRLASTAVDGTVLVASECDGQSATEQSLILHYLGGYSTVTMPGHARWLDPRRRAAWSHTWVPYDLPGSSGWTAAGAATQTLDAGYLTITGGAGSLRTYTVAPTASVANGYVVLLSMTAVSGGGLASATVSALVRLDDGVASYQITINVATTGYRVLDTVAGAQVGTDQTIAATSGLELLIGFAAGKLRVWHRLRSASTLRSWTLGVSSDALTAGGAGAGNLIVWGHRAVGVATSQWHTVAYAEGTEAGYGLQSGQTNPDDLHPCPMSAIEGTFIASSIRLLAEGGPCVRGDTWTIEPVYDYALARIMPSSGTLSPRWGWRSTSTAEQRIAIQLSDVGDTTTGSDVVGIAGLGCNIPRIQVHGYDADSSTWVDLGTVDLHEGLSGLRWVREGSAVSPDTSGSSSTTPYLYHEEAAGWTFAGSDTLAWRVTHNAEGKWTNAATRRPSLMVTGATSLEATSGTGGKLIPSDWCVLVDVSGARYSALRITVPAPASGIPEPAENYWQIGTLVVGPVVVHGDESGWGRTLDTEPGAELTEFRDGVRVAATIAPPRRAIEYGWPDGVDTTTASDPDGDPDPDYFEASADTNALGIAARGDTPWTVEGVIRRLGGAASAVVYLPRIPRFEADTGTIVLNRRHELMLGRVTSTVALDTVQGNELENEVVRVAALRIEEET